LAAYRKYVTLQGDTFDAIALDFYNDEIFADIIIQANPDYTNVILFDAGVELKVPVLEEKAASTLPPWRTS